MVRHLPPHPRRDDLLALVKAEPGMCLREIRITMGWSPSVTRHHAYALASAGKITVRRIGYRVCLFPVRPAARDAWRLEAAGRQEGLLTVLGLLARQGPMCYTRLLDALEQLGMPRSTAHGRLKRLVALDLVSRRDKGRLCIYTASAQ